MDFQIVSSQTPVENGDFAAVCVIIALRELTLFDDKQPKIIVGWSLMCGLQCRCQTLSDNVVSEDVTS